MLYECFLAKKRASEFEKKMMKEKRKIEEKWAWGELPPEEVVQDQSYTDMRGMIRMSTPPKHRQKVEPEEDEETKKQWRKLELK